MYPLAQGITAQVRAEWVLKWTGIGTRTCRRTGEPPLQRGPGEHLRHSELVGAELGVSATPAARDALTANGVHKSGAPDRASQPQSGGGTKRTEDPIMIP
jgi:hypothetical protein